ncbi:hypothetical protein [Kibdelosporangium phytohabitans]|uniref:PE domain-containing protein n=1 Tax=Kibdelosporangium phytohabitans TaxID=860235 RepID=A0A0N9HUZ6_9PSEU|nr:hypothetical protein [Kibdelosporangium phytohabitans]ALG07363.1 hypothetical protein AOZ06_10900 [Kibdelosporangium phytohabitans]MBE1471761.1 hypothetical protein [Kibdelosporangium phytohabitans]
MSDEGFEIDLADAQKAADVALPNLANHLRGPVTVLFSHEGLHGPGGNMPAVDNVQSVYAHYTDALAERLRHGREVIDATARTLRDIVTVYRRADGQI